MFFFVCYEGNSTGGPILGIQTKSGRIENEAM